MRGCSDWLSTSRPTGSQPSARSRRFHPQHKASTDRLGPYRFDRQRMLAETGLDAPVPTSCAPPGALTALLISMTLRLGSASSWRRLEELLLCKSSRLG